LKSIPKKIKEPIMNYKIKTITEHFKNTSTPKRILSLDGGGLKGILTIGILEKIENLLRIRHGGGDEFRLCHYFDLMAGTSTGSIIATLLSLGWTVEEIKSKYMQLGSQVFEKGLFCNGFLRAKYDASKLSAKLKEFINENTTLGGSELKTGLLIVTKRMDTGSPWPLSNNPQGKYFGERPNGVIANSKYPLWKVVRASTAAPTYFDPEYITIAEEPGFKPVQGNFSDGGVSCFNNPALQALMFVTLEGYNVNWQTGEDRLLMVSIGTGKDDPRVKLSKIAADQGIKALQSLMNDAADLQEVIMQWVSNSRTAKEFDREIGNMRNDLLAGSPLITYNRYNADLREDSVLALIPDVDKKALKNISEMDAPENMDVLYRIGKAEAEKSIREEDFPSLFDIEKA
jgi:patatin-like phospholipase/acyl hydrolase